MPGAERCREILLEEWSQTKKLSSPKEGQPTQCWDARVLSEAGVQAKHTVSQSHTLTERPSELCAVELWSPDGGRWLEWRPSHKAGIPTLTVKRELGNVHLTI